jgi:mannose-1-phosphate guanylyltransferase/mannose-6-phosphate isomerase
VPRSDDENRERRSVIIPCILSGGSGSRLWPLSRSLRPKQFLPLFDGESLFQNTLSRFSGSRFAAPIVIANAEHRFLVGEQMATADTGAGTIVLEPVGRNTAAPAAVAALTALEADPDALVLLAPSDHLVRDADEFAGRSIMRSRPPRPGGSSPSAFVPASPTPDMATSA